MSIMRQQQINNYYNSPYSPFYKSHNHYNSSNFTPPYNINNYSRHKILYDMNLYNLPTISYKDNKVKLRDRSLNFIYKPHNNIWYKKKIKNYIYDMDSTIFDRTIQLTRKAKRQKVHMANNTRNRINLIYEHVSKPLNHVNQSEWWSNLYEDDEFIMHPRENYSSDSINLLYK